MIVVHVLANNVISVAMCVAFLVQFIKLVQELEVSP